MQKKITDEQVKICLRCNKEFDNPMPEVTNPNGNTEIATAEWCADCNKLTMNVIYRDRTAYKVKLLGRTLIAVDLTSPTYKERSPKGEELREIRRFMKEAEETARKWNGHLDKRTL